MTRAAVALLLAALVIALATRRRQPRPPAWQEPEDGVQPVDVYLVTLARDDPRIGTFSRN